MLGRALFDFTWTHSQSSDHHGMARELLPWLGGATQVPHPGCPVSRGAKEQAGSVNTGYLLKREKSPGVLVWLDLEMGNRPGAAGVRAWGSPPALLGWECTACGHQYPALRWELCRWRSQFLRWISGRGVVETSIRYHLGWKLTLPRNAFLTN